MKVKVGTKSLILQADEIVYIEKANKSVRVYITETAAKKHEIEWNCKKRSGIRAPGRLIDIYQRFQSYGFGYPHDSYIVNLKYVISFAQEELRMEGYAYGFYYNMQDNPIYVGNGEECSSKFEKSELWMDVHYKTNVGKR